MSNINNNYNPFPQTTLSRTNSNGDIKIFHTTVIPTINPNIISAMPGYSQTQKNKLNDIEWLLPPDLPYFRVDQYDKNLLRYSLYTIHEEDEDNKTQ